MKFNLSFLLFFLLVFFLSVSVECGYNPFFGVGQQADVAYPKISITSPNNTDSVGQTFTITGRASDDKSLKTIKFITDGYTQTEIPAKEDWSSTIDASTLSDGNHRFTITVVDGSDKETTTYLNVFLDKTGPEITVYLPEFGSTAKQLTGSIDFVGMTIDSGTGVKNDPSVNRFIICSRDESSTIFTQSLSEGTWSIENFNTKDYPEGPYKIKISFSDNLGNESIWEHDIVISHEENKPYLVLDTPDPNAEPAPTINKYLTIHGTATDNNAISKVWYNIRNSSGSFVYTDYQAITTSYEFLKSIDITTLNGGSGLSNGIYWVVSYAEDNEGNLSDTKESRFIVDDSVPTITILDSNTDPTGDTPAIMSYINNDFNVRIQCSTTGATIKYKVTQNSHDTGWNPWSITNLGNEIYFVTIDVSDLKSSYSFDDGSIIVKFNAEKDTKTSENQRIFNMDITPPTINFISHTNYQNVNGAVTLNGSAYDSLELDTTIDVFNPDPAINRWMRATGSTLWTYVVSTDTLGEDIGTKFGVADDETSDALFKVRAHDRAGNETIKELHLIINPGEDIPVLTLLTPSSSGQKVSGSLSILAAMDDDDYPANDMTAKIEVYHGTTLVTSQNYDKNSNGFPNLSMIVDTETLQDGETYTIKINGSDWHGKSAKEITCDFVVDKNTPIVEITNPTNDSFKNSTINFTGKIKDENNISSLRITYIDNVGATITQTITTTEVAPESGKRVWTFDCNLNNAGNETGFSTGGSNFIDWADDEWGNNSHLFTIRATDETGLIGSQSVMVNLDNHHPSVNISSPTDGHVIGYNDGGILEIKGGIDDTPLAGISYTLDFNMIRIELWKAGVFNSVIKDWSEGSSPNFTVGSTPQNFTYNWNYSVPDANDYSIVLKAKDDASNDQTATDSVNFIKNQYPPAITNISYTTKTHYKGTISFSVDAEDRGTTPTNGVKSLELLVDGVVQPAYTKTWSTPEPLSVSGEVFDFNTVTYGNDGLHEIAFRVTDETNITHLLSAGNFVFDNVKPAIQTPTYYTLGYSNPITNYSTYLGFSMEVTDDRSLVGDNPQFTIGTSSGANDILDWTYFNGALEWNGQKDYTATFSNYINLFQYSGTIYINIKATDSAGNEQISEFTITKAALPSLDLDLSSGDYLSDVIDGATDGYTSISGTVTTGQDILWIKIDSGAENIISSYSGGTTFDHPIINSSLSNGEHTFRVRCSKNGIQSIVEKNFIIDNSSPTITINNGVQAKDASGHVSTDYSNLSGTIIFSGTYTDNNKDDTSITQANLEINIAGAGWVSIPPANIIKNFGADKWTWNYEWDSQNLSTVVGLGETIQVRATDRGQNQNTDSMTKNIVPYISSLSSSDTTNYPVFDINYYQDSSWSNHNNRRYSLAQNTPLIINGYNLKNSGNPTVKLGSSVLTVSTSSTSQITLTIPTNDTTGKSGDLLVTVNDGAQDIDSSTIKCVIWKFNRIGDSYDTLDARDFDMSLIPSGVDVGKAMVTFARDHQVTQYSTEMNDYSTYRIKEGDSTAYNSFGGLDPCWFASNVIIGTDLYIATSLDEFTDMWGVATGYTGIKKIQLSTTNNFHFRTDSSFIFDANGQNAAGLFGTHATADWSLIISRDGSDYKEFNTAKYGSITKNANNWIYLALYDDDSRSTTPVPTLYVETYSSSGSGQKSDQAIEITNSNNPGPWNSIAADPSSSNSYRSVVSYYTTDNNKLNLAYANAQDASSFTHNTAVSSNISGGKYNSLAISGNFHHLSYQSDDISLAYSVLYGVTDSSPSTIILEHNSDKGITGFDTSICTDNNGYPYISYINNSELNSNEGLHLARYIYTGSLTESNLTTAEHWEYMDVPSPVSVNSSKTIIRWDSNDNIPVVAFKGNNLIFVARIVQ